MLAHRYVGRTMFGFFLLNMVVSLIPPIDATGFFVFLVLQQAVLGLGGYLGSVHMGRVALRLSWQDLGKGVVGGVALFFLMGFVTMGVAAVLAAIWSWETVLQWLLAERSGVTVLLEYATEVSIWPVVLLTVVGAALSEEFFFRGLLIPWLETVTGQRRALLASAFLFAVFHRYLLHFPAMFSAGLWLGYLFRFKYRVWTAIAAHGLANAIVLGLNFLGQ